MRLRRLWISCFSVALLMAADGWSQDAPHVLSGPGTERSRSQSNRDDLLTNLIQRRMAEADRPAHRAAHVAVWGNRVLLLGAVPSPQARQRAEDVARAADGVIQVFNDLQVVEDSQLDRFALDFGREELIRHQLGLDGKAGAIVRVVDQQVYLLGAASSPSQISAAESDALKVQGIKRVIPHLTLP